ncbi:hypothetical protein Ntsu_81130 [Nocardia sp. IFM 10818]
MLSIIASNTQISAIATVAQAISSDSNKAAPHPMSTAPAVTPVNTTRRKRGHHFASNSLDVDRRISLITVDSTGHQAPPS